MKEFNVTLSFNGGEYHEVIRARSKCEVREIVREDYHPSAIILEVTGDEVFDYEP